MKHSISIQSIVSIVLVAALTLAVGVIHGRMRNRWGPPADAQVAVDRMQEIPLEFGNWRCKSLEKLNALTLEILECHGHWVRRYVNTSSGEAVSVTLLLGPAGPIAVHTPEVCFSSQAYKNRSPRTQVSIEHPPAPADQFWVLTYQTSDLRADVLRLYFAWSTGSHWSASSNARYVFAGAPYLYKIQLSVYLPPGVDPEKNDTGRRFLEAFVPVARQYLLEPAGS